MGDVQTFANQVIENVERVIIGKRAAIELVLAALLCEGHVLLEDVPGSGKTMLARSVAASLGIGFKRIQCTPDLMPNDVTGVSIFNQKTGEFEFRAGPIMTQILLADEVNRATPKTQAALLEAMEERQVTVDGVTHLLPSPFLVLATQNPIEYEGTFPLPEAQLDRFMLRISLGYPMLSDEIRMLERQQLVHPLESLQKAVEVSALQAAQQAVRQVAASAEVKRYILDLVSATRRHGELYLGASPRGSLSLFRCGQAMAALQARAYILPDDIKQVAVAALAHRLILGSSARVREVDSRAIVQDILGSVPVPGGDVRG